MAITLDGTTGITTPGLTNTGTETIVNLTTTGNTILGNASTDTLNVGNGDLVKDASGNVIISGTSAGAVLNKLQLLNYGGSNNGGVSMEFNDAGAAAKITGLIAGANENAGLSLLFSTSSNTSGATERMRIDTSGNLLLNTTSANAGGRVYSYGNAGQVTFESNCASGTYYPGWFSVGGTQHGYISTSTSGTTYNTTSDYRLKENVQPMVGALAKVALLKPVTYNWIETKENGQGFIAHELQEVVPECVSGKKDGMMEDGRPFYQGVDTSNLVATLTAAIQEQQAMIDELKAKVAALEAA